jgi:hypothetical protein
MGLAVHRVFSLLSVLLTALGASLNLKELGCGTLFPKLL